MRLDNFVTSQLGSLEVDISKQVSNKWVVVSKMLRRSYRFVTSQLVNCYAGASILLRRS